MKEPEAQKGWFGAEAHALVTGNPAAHPSPPSTRYWLLVQCPVGLGTQWISVNKTSSPALGHRWEGQGKINWLPYKKEKN